MSAMPEPAASAPASRLAPWLVGLLACLLALPFAFGARVFPDEFTLASDGLRIAHGAQLYRDFFEFIGPVSGWFAAAVFALAGASIVAERVALALVVGVAAAGLYLAGRRLDVSPAGAALPGILLAGGLYASLPGLSHHWLVLPFVSGALALALAERWALAGACASVAVLTIQSDGIAAAAAFAAWILLDAWLGGRSLADTGRRLGFYAAGLALPLVVTAGYLLATHALGAAIADVWAWPLAQYRRAGGFNDVRYLTDLAAIASTNRAGFRLSMWYAHLALALVVMLLPLALAVLGAAGLAGAALERLRGARWAAPDARLALAWLVAMALFAAALRGRTDYNHLAFIAPVGLLVATVLAERWRRFAVALPGTRWLPYAGLVALLPLMLVCLADRVRDEPGIVPRAGGADAVYRQAPLFAYLQAHARPGDRLAATPLGGAFYFYALPPATRYTVMFPPELGYNSAEENAEFWREVAAARPRYVVVSPLNAGEKPVLPISGYRLVGDLPMTPLPPDGAHYLFERADTTGASSS